MATQNTQIPALATNDGKWITISPIIMALIVITILVIGYYLFKSAKSTNCWSLRERFKRLEERQRELTKKGKVLEEA